jgi:hypothetical protein
LEFFMPASTVSGPSPDFLSYFDVCPSSGFLEPMAA